MNPSARIRPRRRWRARHWLLLVVALGLFARLVRYAANFPIFGDEAFVAVNFFQRGLADMTRTLEHDMVVPIGYLVTTLALSQRFGGGELVLRLPALLAGIAALLAFVPLAKRTLPRHSALCAIALFAASYYPIRHGAEVKPYASDLLIALPIYGLGLSLLREPERIGRWLLLALFGAFAMWCSYTAAFVAGGVLLTTATIAVSGRHRGAAPSRAPAVAGWLLAAAAIAASFAAMYLAVGRHQQWSEATIDDSRQWNEHFPPMSEPWLLPWWLVKELTGNMLAYPNGGRVYGCAATTALVTIGAISLWRAGRGRVAALLLSPLVPMFVAAAVRKYPFGGSARTTLHLAIPVCLLAAHGFVAVMRRWLGPRKAHVATCVFAFAMAAVALGSIGSDLFWPRKSEGDARTRAAAHALRDQSQRGDRWIVFGAFHDVPDAPNLIDWRGSAARLEYNLYRDAQQLGVELAWAPPPASIAPGDARGGRARGRTWFLVYRDNEAPFPEAQLVSYRDALEKKLGPPALRKNWLLGPASPDPVTAEPREETLTMLRFDPRK